VRVGWYTSLMSLQLAIVTCGPQLEVALAWPGMATPSLIRLAGVSPRSTLLLAAIDLLLEDAGLKDASLESSSPKDASLESSGLEPGSLGSVLVSRGPGSFTGIRAGLASAAGLGEATGARVIAFDSLLMQAARCASDGSRPSTVWAAQPGRRGEVYARAFELAADRPPAPAGELVVLAVETLADRGPWIAAESLDLGRAVWINPCCSAAEALLKLECQGASPQALEPLYVDGPPIHGRTP